ncbi:hypothetical protein [Streptomyces lavendulae]|uniref:hypothetical protein n=1 Tax=Streptomyces lavendulae TaxID=1914 RepID=UPI0025538072|nr:hypothetical protein [Streptomyces lavendulae]
MPQINLPPNTPWWFVGLLALLLVLAFAFCLIAGSLMPRHSRDRLNWWKLWFNRPRK